MRALPSIHLAALVLCALLASCARGVNGSREEIDVLVVAPHPDDEELIAAGVMRAAIARGQRVAIIVMTNGDYTCERNGYVRELESVTFASFAGVPERDIHFLGYPGGDLALMGPVPLPLLERRGPDGRCVKAGWTYATHGASKRDEHAARTGRPGEYIAESITQDLAALVLKMRPRDVYITHAIDEHPDHAATYSYFRRALDRIGIPAPRVHRAVVHAGRCWPGDCVTPYRPEAGIPPLAAPRESYVPRERLPVDPAFKLEVLSAFESQIAPGLKQNWLSSFVRTEEVFYAEQLSRSDGGWLRPTATEQSPQELVLEFKDFPLLRLTASRDKGLDEFEMFLSHDRVTLNRLNGWHRRRIGVWLNPGPERLPPNDCRTHTMPVPAS